MPPKHSSWYTDGLAHIWPPYGQYASSHAPLPVVRTEGCHIVLEDGTKLVDGIASWWSAAHGYNHPHIVKAIQDQAAVMPHVMLGGLAHEQAYRLATRLSAITPGKGKLSRVFFSDSGSVAVEVAMKIALQYWLNQGKPKKDRFVCFHDGYHGDTFGAMGVSDPDRGMHKAFRNNVTRQFAFDIPSGEYEFSDFAEALKEYAPQIAGLIMEPLVQGAGGMRFHSPDTLAEIYRLCKEFDILFIADEIFTGFGRTGLMFACDEAGIVPDLLCIGKALSGGALPLAATLAQEEIYAAFVGENPEKALMHGPTFMANALACAAANASLDLFEKEDRLQQVEAIERQLYDELKNLSALSGVLDVRVKGAIGVVELAPGYQNIPELRKAFIAEGVWVRPFSNVIYLAPPLVISKAELSRLTEAVHKIVSSWSAGVREKIGYLFDG
ncbi:MAG: adenosylmethionine--8-amino-7-oxononanoate transaminase [Rickettsiales bacterium]